MVPTNQVQFTVLTKHTTNRLGGTLVVSSIGFLKGNNVGFGSEIGVVLVIKIGISSDGNYGVSIGYNIEIDAGGDLGDMEVCLGIVLVIIVSLAIFLLNIVVSIFLIGHNYLIFVSFMV